MGEIKEQDTENLRGRTGETQGVDEEVLGAEETKLKHDRATRGPTEAVTEEEEGLFFTDAQLQR